MSPPLWSGAIVIVVDASVLATALADTGPTGKRARGRMRGETLVAPELIDIEVTSVFRGLVRGGRLEPKIATSLIADLRGFPMSRESHAPLLDRCWELRDNLTPYDAVYVALAESLRVPLVTGDRKSARAPGLRCFVEVIAAGSVDDV